MKQIQEWDVQRDGDHLVLILDDYFVYLTPEMAVAIGHSLIAEGDSDDLDSDDLGSGTVRTSDKMQLNPEPLKIVKLAMCRKCGRSWGLRGTCVCLDPDVVWPDPDD